MTLCPIDTSLHRTGGDWTTVRGFLTNLGCVAEVLVVVPLYELLILDLNHVEAGTDFVRGVGDVVGVPKPPSV